MSAFTPVAGRECGDCTCCCVELAIETPELRKPDGCDCPHIVDGIGCGIYADRPVLCRNWYCGWRMGALSDEMRPDQCGVLLAPEIGRAPGYQRGGMRIILTRADRATLSSEKLLDFVARCVIGAVPIWLSWGDGTATKRYLVNDDLKPPLNAGNKLAFYRALDNALHRLIKNVEAPD